MSRRFARYLYGKQLVRRVRYVAVCLAMCVSVFGQPDGARGTMLASLVSTHDYVQKRASSYDRSGGNDDSRRIAAGSTIELLNDRARGLSLTSGSRSLRPRTTI